MEPEEEPEFLGSHDKMLRDEELLFMDEQWEWFLEAESSPGEGALRMVGMTTKDLEYYTNNKAAAPILKELKGLTPILEVLLWAKWYQTVSHAMDKLFVKRRSSWHTNFIVVLS